MEKLKHYAQKNILAGDLGNSVDEKEKICKTNNYIKEIREEERERKSCQKIRKHML